MKRNEFIQLSALAAAGLIFAPSLFSCQTVNIETDFKGKIIIIGAGAAGLYAGYILKQNNIPYMILEADSVAGGRTKFNSEFCDFNIDLGAEWLHGGNSIFADFIEEKGVSVYKDNSGGEYWHQDKITEELSPGIKKLLRGVFDSDLADISLEQYCKEELGLSGSELNFAEYVAGEYGASANSISVKWAAIEEENWNAGNSDFKFPASLGQFISAFLINELQENIVLNTEVKTIDYTENDIQIGTSSGVFKGEKVICSVPITQLKAGKIQFTPALSKVQTDAINSIEMGPGMKVFLKFSEKFYGDGILGTTASPAYVDAAYGKNAKDHVLMAFVMGERALKLSEMGEDKATQLLLDELETVYGEVAKSSFLDSFTQDWHKNKWVAGAYSYAPVGQGKDKRMIAAKPVASKIYFAGEAMNTNGHHQSVHGAMETGKKCVQLILV
jgi:monoamine oxidase